MTTKDTERAESQARAQLDSIILMVKRLEHISECNGEDCQLSDKEILEGINIYFKEGMTASEEDPLSVQVRSDWHTPGEDSSPSEYMILLCTGGPAVRIVGDLGQYQEPETATIEYQDWFTPWQRYSDTSSKEDDALLTFARQFYFGS